MTILARRSESAKSAGDTWFISVLALLLGLAIWFDQAADHLGARWPDVLAQVYGVAVFSTFLYLAAFRWPNRRAARAGFGVATGATVGFGLATAIAQAGAGPGWWIFVGRPLVYFGTTYLIAWGGVAFIRRAHRFGIAIRDRARVRIGKAEPPPT